MQTLVHDAIRVGLIGDYDATVTAHQAIPRALALAGASEGVTVTVAWVPTGTITTDAVVAPFDALWCVPASPYRSTDGALRAIRFAREQGRPFLGTCGGFQHAVLEYARTVLGWSDAEHAETAPDADRLVVTPLTCALVEARDVVRFREGSRLRAAYGVAETVEGYHCRYGLNADVRSALTTGPLRVAAEDASGDVRALELDAHPFFVVTLFQPERAALRGEVPPVVAAFVRAAAEARSGRPIMESQPPSPFPSAAAYASEPVRHPPLEVVDILAEQRAIDEAYRNLVLSRVNTSCLRLAVFHGEYRWHRHPHSDELFLVVDGRLEIDLAAGGSLALGPWQCVVIPAGTVHRTRAIGRTVNLTVEALGAETEFVEAPT